MNLRDASLHRIHVPMKQPFTTTHGSLTEREVIIVELTDDEGRKGYGEIAAFSTPFYTEETVETAWHITLTYLLPLLKNRTSLTDVFRKVKGHPMAKAGVEQAWFDLQAKRKGVSLRSYIGGIRTSVAAGGVISLEGEIEGELQKVKDAGFHRAKVKVARGREDEQLARVREVDPSFPLMIDGNGGYESVEELLPLEKFNLVMIEQPFRAGDLYKHRALQERMKTPVCLDESIRSYEDAAQAHILDAASIFNIKISRVGGWTEALAIHEMATREGIPLWCGGMVETGIGKAHSLALASLSSFTLPGDLSGSDRYFEKDVITEPILMRDGYIDVPEAIGIGVEPDKEFLSFCRSRIHTVTY